MAVSVCHPEPAKDLITPALHPFDKTPTERHAHLTSAQSKHLCRFVAPAQTKQQKCFDKLSMTG
jgi:hypothetical protein